MRIQLVAFLLLFCAAFGARAEDCSSYPGATLDGAAGTPAPSQLYVDTHCTIKNYSNFDTNISFSTQPGQTDERWLLIFDNAIHTGQMACNAVAGHKTWFVNGSESERLFDNPQCQNSLIPVEKIDKQTPGQFVSVGVPFTYRLVIPVLFDPATGTTVPIVGSNNDLHTVVVTDDLNATGVDLSVVGTPTVTWIGNGAALPHTFSNVGNLLTFQIDPTNSGVQIPANAQIAIDITVVLNNNPGLNSLGTTFSNTANWSFGRAIDLDDSGTVDPGEFFTPLPGERGISPPMTIAGPNLVVDKSGSTERGGPTINLGEWGMFTIDVLNTGQFAAWNVTVLDQLPDDPTGGMCDLTPEILGVTLGGVTLTQGTQYALSYTSAPTCQLSITLLDAAGAIAPGAHLLVNYRSKIDANSETGAILENIAGATRWFNDASSNGIRQEATDPLTNGTSSTVDNEDVYTTNVFLTGYFFQKSVRNVTSGADPAVTAYPGEVLHYTLRLRTTDAGFSDVRFRDQLPADFVPGSLNFTQLPPGAVNNSNPATGLVEISGIDMPAGSIVTVEFDVQLRLPLANGHIVQNQAQLLDVGGALLVVSDDAALPGNVDPTQVTIVSAPAFRVQKSSYDVTGDPALLLPGDTLRYSITVKNVGTDNAVDAVFRDNIPANTTYVAGTTMLNGAPVADVGGQSPLVNGILVNAPEDATPGAMRADPTATIANVATITFDVMINPSVVAGTVIANQGFVSAPADGLIDVPSDDPDTVVANDPTRDVVTGFLFTKSVRNVTSGADPAVTAYPGEVLHYTLRLQTANAGVTDVRFRDQLPADFVPGSLNFTLLPPGAVNSSNPASGLVDISGIDMPASSIVNVEFDVKLLLPLANGHVVQNQAELLDVGGALLVVSDDAALPGSIDPTRVTIVSAPAFRVQKSSYDVTGDPVLLLPGDTLRYSITVKNVGTDNAVDAVFRDNIPANTTYVAGTTMLNGAPVADVGGQSPLVNGILVNAPEDATPGAMRADPTATIANVATITFDVMINPSVVAGTVIANQGFVSAPADGLIDVPSDDPDTVVANDPTRDVVGDRPLLYADKRAVLEIDLNTPGVVDPGDTLRYTITVYNTGTADATGAVLSDAVPANTTYVADSLRLNTLPRGQPDAGVFPLVAGLDISSSDLTPPLPGAGQGVIAVGQSSVVQFSVRVNAGVTPGTIITNQAALASTELPQLLTDGDGNPSTGPEPTVVVVGPAQQLSISKQVTVVGGGPALAGGYLEYVVRVRNIGTVPATAVRIRDNLDADTPGTLTYVDMSATLDGTAAGIVVTGRVITVDYAAAYGTLAPGQTTTLRFRAQIASSLPVGTRITNTGVVEWNTPLYTARASVSVDVGAVTGVGVLIGTVWHDGNFNVMADAAELLLEGWSVELYRRGQLVHTTQTDAGGAYLIAGIEPNYISNEPLELRFAAPGAGAATAKLGRAYSQFTNGMQQITGIIVQPGSILMGMHMPIQPNGVVYNSVGRLPIAGAVVTMRNATSGQALPQSCFLDPVQQGQVTLPYGYYKFDLNFADAACLSGAGYLLDVTPPSSTYIAGNSTFIPPATDSATAPFSVPSCPAGIDDALPATDLHCEAQISEFAPGAAVPARSIGTRYFMHLSLADTSIPGSSQMFNNHIPVDPDLRGVLTISKTTSLLNVSRGQLVPYVIKLRNTAGFGLTGLRLVDRYPAGFRYVAGSARIDGQPVEPVQSAAELAWNDVDFASAGERTITLLLVVGAGVGEGEFINRAQAFNGLTGEATSGEASATVRVVPDPTFDCTDITGIVFDDTNRNGRQDGSERGLAGVRLVTPDGLAPITDARGRYHLTCAVVPRETRGSNFVLKLDDRSLPSGYRPSTDQLRIARATRGKALNLNFGASIHRAVSLDLAGDVFEPGTTSMRPQWRPRLKLLLDELLKSPSVLRLSYLADVEDPRLVDQRLQAVKQEIMDAWQASGATYRLVIEPEIFWRRGGPPERPSSSAGAAQ